MTKNPIINALSATLYIALVASIMFYGELMGKAQTILIPIAILSLFTLSAAVMAYIFGFQPIQLYLDGKKKAAVNLFLQTIGAFGIITAILFILLLSGVLPR